MLARWVTQAFLQHRKKFLCHITVHKTNLGSIAHRRTAHFCIFNYSQCHGKVGILVHIDMADSSACLNTRNKRLLYACLYKSCTAAWNQKINKTNGTH